MSTTPVESWAVDLAELGPIYPFVGSEGLMIALGFAAWIGWHIWQIRNERREDEETARKLDAAARAKGEADPSGGESGS